MTHKERFIKALKREPITGLVPHFELVFYLTMEAFRKVHPIHRHFDQWNQMSKEERELQLDDIARVYVKTAEHYEHSAIFVHSDFMNYDFTAPLLHKIREISGNEYFIMLHGDPTFPIPDGDSMMEFSRQLFEEKEVLHDKAKRQVVNYRYNAERYKGSGL
ncbi:MAG: hypothetical protein PHV32_18130, partial [Eubacteriales bacterium]|nr:hypothetical protein [Eubacteriales bacterium]